MNDNNNSLIKTAKEQEIMIEGGKILAEMLAQLQKMVVPGLDTWFLEETFLDLCAKKNVIPSCLNYNPIGNNPFPTGLCVSVNSQSVHCFPKKGFVLKKHDIVSVDTVIKHKGLNVDAAFCVSLGQNVLRKKLESTSKFAVEQAIKTVKPGSRIGDISYEIEKTAKDNNLNVLRDYAGHGIGYEMHEDPEIPCYGKKGTGMIILEGMVLCVEALLCSGSPHIYHKSLWETEMNDSGDFGMYEDTVLVTKNGYKVLTLR